MNKLLPLLLALVFVGAGCASIAPVDNSSTNGTDQQNGQEVAENTVVIKDFIFGPATIEVKKGATVTWMNTDSAQHSVVADSGKWQSELLTNGQTYQHTFDTVGTFTYHCGLHTYMKGTVVVTE